MDTGSESEEHDKTEFEQADEDFAKQIFQHRKIQDDSIHYCIKNTGDASIAEIYAFVFNTTSNYGALSKHRCHTRIHEIQVLRLIFNPRSQKFQTCCISGTSTSSI